MHKIFLVLFVLVNSFFGSAQSVTFHNFDGRLSIGAFTNRTASITLIDIDKDGDLDALIANGRHWAQQNYIYFNDGDGAPRVLQPADEAAPPHQSTRQPLRAMQDLERLRFR